jgi:hypothetical protein
LRGDSVSGESDNEKKKTDWKKTEDLILRSSLPPAEIDDSGEESTGGELSVRPAMPIAAPIPDAKAVQGILAQWKSNNLERSAALAALKENYSSQLDVLKHCLTAAARVKKTQADVMAEEYLKELDARHLEVLTEIGLRNKDTREKALLELTDRTVEKLREVQGKDWPEALIEDTIQKLLGLRERLVAEILEELGREYR